jgi:hypothetical protein
VKMQGTGVFLCEKYTEQVNEHKTVKNSGTQFAVSAFLNGTSFDCCSENWLKPLFTRCKFVQYFYHFCAVI